MSSASHRQKAARHIKNKTGLTYQQSMNCLLEAIAEAQELLRETPPPAAPTTRPTPPAPLPTLLTPPDDTCTAHEYVPQDSGTVASQPIAFTIPVLPLPVVLNPHDLIKQNNPPGIAITGAPGSGKSFFTATVADRFMRDNVRTVYIDPHADSIGVASLHPDMKVIDLRERNPGALNPFNIGDTPSERALNALIVARILVRPMSEEREAALINAIEEIAEDENPSLELLTRTLQASDNVHAKRLGDSLWEVSQLPNAELIFGNGPALALPGEGESVLISMAGIPIPTGNEFTWRPVDMIGLAAMVLTLYVTRKNIQSLTRETPKAVIIRRADTLTNVHEGSRAIMELTRLGRSKNLSVVLEADRSDAFHDPWISSHVSAKVKFRTPNSLKGWDPDSDLGDTIAGLGNGEFLLQLPDAEPVIARLTVNEELFEAFNYPRGKPLS